MRRRLDIRLSLVVLIVAALGQAAFALSLRDRHPPWDVLGPAPTITSLRLSGLGDDQMVFRALGVTLLNAGDTGGRVTPLRAYDYDFVADWLTRLDTLDPASDMMSAMAAFYFGATPDAEDAARMVPVLIDMVRDHPERWRFLAHGTFIAKHRAHDPALALRAARVLADLPGDRPLWTRQMPAFILADMGEKDAAAAILGALLSDPDSLPPDEVRFMRRMLEIYQNASP